MGMFFRDMLEIAASEKELERYRSLAGAISWENEIQHLLNTGGRMNIALSCLNGLSPDISPQSPALIIPDLAGARIITRAELSNMVQRLAGGFKNTLKIKSGEPVALFLPNGQELAASLLALAWIGAVAAPIIDIYRAEPVKSRLNNLKPRVLITSKELVEQLDPDTVPSLRKIVLADDPREGFAALLENRPEPPEMVEPHAPFIIHYTSGTFGVPRGALHSHSAAAGTYRTAELVFSLAPGKTMWCTAHPAWLPGAVYGLFGPLLCGAATVLASGKPDPGILAELRPTAVYSIPSTISRIFGGPNSASGDAASVEVLASTGERLSPAIVAQVKERYGLSILDTWCMTETGMIMISGFPFTPVKPGSVGLPVPGVRARVVNESGLELPPNTLGILAFERNWPSIMRGVWGDGGAMADMLASKLFITTDYAFRDDDGYYWVQGRGEEFIKRGSERISPFELEDVLLTHSAVSEVAAIQYSKDGKERIKVFTVLTAGFEPGEELNESMKEHIRENMGGYAVPDEIEFLDELPKTRTGKVLRRTLKAKEQNLPEE